MNKHISNFLNKVSEQIQYKSVLGSISEELKSHIYELTDGYIEDGMSEDEAIQKAVKQMGNPVHIGKELNKTHRPKTEWSIISLLGAMVLIGGIALFSIASDQASLLNLDQFLKSYLIYTFIGIGVCTACYFFDYTKLEKYSLFIFIVTIAFLFISQKSSAHVYGVPYIRIGGFSFNPVSIALPFYLISFSGLTNKWVPGNIMDMLKILGLASLAVLTLLFHPSFSNAMLLSGGFIILITIAVMGKGFVGNRKRILTSIYGSVTLGILLLLLHILGQGGYKAARLLVFLNPNSDPSGAGYINFLLNEMLSSAKLFGKSDNLYLTIEGVNRIALPEINTDFVFAYIVSAFGWIIGMVTIMVITLAVVRMFLATRKINHLYGKYLACSIVSVFTLQALGNILMNIGMAPILGFSLPFISYGGINFVVNMALIGVLLGVYRRKDLVIVKQGQLNT
ncbi:cell division protein FtsW, lipid II flippase [Anaerovirgula multivorans]|uniref:Cell division protein FtsW, lipid II flippase n=1 Tax=Anaerovirgula multivorans TaxID=312168 RepID=A0A239DAZ4_9FIRM|nr:FtsW/RodA/SpoVE family cell cycle protein [Anaerovirgula multivorans]SNS29480.1 cell division protein FtsW, lipid II flippase [Anaerovirgula multivorans]